MAKTRAANAAARRREFEARRVARERAAEVREKPPTGKQLDYIASMARQLDRDTPEVFSRSSASAAITQLKNQLATARQHH